MKDVPNLINRIMKYLIIVLINLLINYTYSQATFTVSNFSKDYVGKVFISDTNEVFSKGSIAILDKKTKKQKIKVESEELAFTLHDGKILANISELPYGEQSLIMFEDYNFDGKKDFAIMDGQNSCYHGPSYQIYLATLTGFKLSSEFTRLAQEYCGMFNINPKEKTISTMTKSGCCWHQFSEFQIKDNKPYAIKILEEDLGHSGLTLHYVEQNLVKGKMIESEYSKLNLDINNDNLILSFEFENKKKLQIINFKNSIFYVFEDSNEKIELIYNDIFKYSRSENTLTFTNYNTEYIIYDDKVIAITPNKTYNMKSVDKTRIGTLAKLKNINIENVKM